MDRYCDDCKRSYPEERDCCPYCEANARHDLQADDADFPRRLQDDSTPLPFPTPDHWPEVSFPAPLDEEIDLGSPVTAPEGMSDQPSGASIISWDAFIPPPGDSDPKGPTCRDGLTDVEPFPSASDPEIDLGSPVNVLGSESGQQSGASAYSWSARLRSQEESEKSDENPPVRIASLSSAGIVLPPATGETGSASRRPRQERSAKPVGRLSATNLLVKAPAAERARLHPAWCGLGGALIGIVGTGVLCIGLWSAGYEPPGAWRDQVQHWLGRSDLTSDPRPDEPSMTDEMLTP